MDPFAVLLMIALAVAVAVVLSFTQVRAVRRRHRTIEVICPACEAEAIEDMNLFGFYGPYPPVPEDAVEEMCARHADLAVRLAVDDDVE